VVLVTGEPGIGKSGVLAHIGECLTSAGGRAFAARTYEAEAARPYGVWIDVIREILRESPRDGLPADLGLLLPEMGAVPEARDRTRLLDAVLCLLRRTPPTSTVLPDAGFFAKRVTLSLALRSSGDAGRGFGGVGAATSLVAG
jgi:predicted ATPase